MRKTNLGTEERRGVRTSQTWMGGKSLNVFCLRESLLVQPMKPRTGAGSGSRTAPLALHTSTRGRPALLHDTVTRATRRQAKTDY